MVEDGRGGSDTGTVTVEVQADPGTTSLPIGDAQTVAFTYEVTVTKAGEDDQSANTEVVVGDPGSVARSQGKAVRVVDNRYKG